MSYTLDKKLPKKIETVVKEAYNKMNTLWPISQSIHFSTCSGRTRNGYCRKYDRLTYEIRINKDLVNSEDILEVACHEILHSYPNVFKDHHGGEWAKRAVVIRNKYNIEISRTNSFERSQTYQSAKVKYVFNCTHCNHEWKYKRKPCWFDRIGDATCPYCKTNTIALILDKSNYS